MKQYPIWMDVTSCIYKSNKSYGIQRHGVTRVQVGTSKSNSHLFTTLELKRRDLDNGGREFTLFVDGKPIKVATVVNGVYKERSEHEKPTS